MTFASETTKKARSGFKSNPDISRRVPNSP
jgi:hypothetical protein